MPPAVTRESSRKKLWKELECVRQEVDSQQSELIGAREALKRNQNELALLRYQVETMRAVLNLNIVP